MDMRTCTIYSGKKHCIRPVWFTSREKNKLMTDDPFKATFFVFSAFQQGYLKNPTKQEFWLLKRLTEISAASRSARELDIGLLKLILQMFIHG